MGVRTKNSLESPMDTTATVDGQTKVNQVQRSLLKDVDADSTGGDEDDVPLPPVVQPVSGGAIISRLVG